jgi:taurine--2-oxoglutarate transaminase
MSTSTINKDLIIKNNLDYTLFSWSKQAGLNPINAEKAEGVYVYDRDGKKYIDFSSQLMNVNIGHGDKRVMDAVMKQMNELQFVYSGMATDIRGRLGKKLTEITPKKLTKVFFTLGGAEAIENAIKLARVYTGRSKIISFYRSYHGATHGAMSASGDPRKYAMDDYQVPNIVHVENPYAYRCPWGTNTPEECGRMAAEQMDRVIQFENPNNVAAILMEGESGSSGCIKYPEGFWKRVKVIADKYGILIIDDEVMSGFGRTGKMFAVEHHGVEPDLMCMAKGLTSGYLPLGAVMEIYQNDKLPENAEKMGKYLEVMIEAMKAKHPSIGDFRNTGLLGCIELVKNRATKEPITPWNASGTDLEVTNKMAAKIKELGMFTFVRWNFIFIAPPLIITKEQIDEGLAIISEVISIADEYCN